jgi:tRNA-uridine aminocarboxypropyltransferase
MCERCRRPRSVCYCDALPHLDTTTRVVILQHPRERDMPIGTARMAMLCLPQAELHVGMRWDEHAGLRTALGDPRRPPILLYPGPGARDILHEPPPGPVTLVVVDGTWSQAKALVRDNPILAALPRYAFTTPELSHYRIRREPRAEYVSTIEALMHVLGVLEGDPARFRALLDPLHRMVDTQLACQQHAPRRTSYRKPAAPKLPVRRLPEAIAKRWDDLVCVAGEANAWPYESGKPQLDELVHWVALRVATGEMFDVIATPDGPLSPNTAFHTDLAEDRIRQGGSRAELFAAFAKFMRPSDLMCTWGHYAPSLFSASGGLLPVERLDLRAAAQKYTNRKVGSLESYVATIGPSAPLTEGRAGRRIAMLAEIVRAWRGA